MRLEAEPTLAWNVQFDIVLTHGWMGIESSSGNLAACWRENFGDATIGLGAVGRRLSNCRCSRLDVGWVWVGEGCKAQGLYTSWRNRPSSSLLESGLLKRARI